MIAMSSNSESTEPISDDELSQDLLSCMEIGDCGIRKLNEGSVAVDLSFDLKASDLKMSRDPETNDLIIHRARILSPGERNQYQYPLDSVKLTRHLKKGLELTAMPSPFVVPHTSNPVEQIGRIDNIGWDDKEQSIVGDPRIYDDPRLPLAQSAIAILEREKGFMSLSTRLKVTPYVDNASGKPSVKDLRLIHVAWVDVGADPTAGKDLSNSDTSQESDASLITTVDLALLPIATGNPSWDGGAAEKRVWDNAKGDGAKAGRAYFWQDSKGDPNLRQTYKLPFADVINGTLTAIPKGVEAAFGAMRGARTPISIPAGDKAGVLAKIKAYYDKMGKPWPLSSASNADTEQSVDTTPQNDEQRGLNMSENEEAQAATPTDPITDQAEVSTPEPTNPTQTPTDAPKPTFSEMADNEEVTLTAGELRKKLSDMQADLYQQFVQENERQALIAQLMEADSEIPAEFLESLKDNGQLKYLKSIIDRLMQKLDERDNSISELQSKQYRLTGEKPSFSASAGAEADLNKLAEKYFSTESDNGNSVRAKMLGKRMQGVTQK